jgi:hypothetical protein
MKLGDTHMIILSTASQRENGSLLPLPEGTAGARAIKAVAALAKSGLAEERETADTDAISRSDGDLRLGVFITAGGLAAIGIEPAGAGAGKGAQNGETDTPAAAPPRTTKSSAVLALLGRAEGATVAELIAATGWLPHTTRAALTGLRKKGHSITRGKRGDETYYTVAAA